MGRVARLVYQSKAFERSAPAWLEAVLDRRRVPAAFRRLRMAFFATDRVALYMEPGGTIGVRVADGSWYDVQFHGPTDAKPEVAPKDCDGCGDAFYRGEPLGTVCVDFSAWTGWGAAPW